MMTVLRIVFNHIALCWSRFRFLTFIKQSCIIVGGFTKLGTGLPQ